MFPHKSQILSVFFCLLLFFLPVFEPSVTNLDHLHYRNSVFRVTRPSSVSSSSIYNSGGHELLVHQLYEACPKTVASSAATLHNMAAQESIRSSILSHGAMRALAEALKSKDTAVLLSSLLCVAELACEEDARAEVFTTNLWQN